MTLLGINGLDVARWDLRLGAADDPLLSISADTHYWNCKQKSKWRVGCAYARECWVGKKCKRSLLFSLDKCCHSSTMAVVCGCVRFGYIARVSLEPRFNCPNIDIKTFAQSLTIAYNVHWHVKFGATLFAFY